MISAMHIAFYIFGEVPVYTFSLLLSMGSCIGLLSVAQRVPGEARLANFNHGLWVLGGAATLGRLAYIAMHWAYYAEHPMEIPQFWLGGLSGVGALVGGLIALLIVAKGRAQRVAELADSLRPLLTTVTLSSWLGCWIEGCFYGPEVQAWWGVPTIDEWGEMNLRWPLQPVSALLTLLVAWVIDWFEARERVSALGMAASLEVGGIALILVWAASLRVDPVPQWKNIAINIWILASLLLIIILVLFISRFRKVS